jgi:dipeptidyl aminopeptidase/acylaminoacyl peptidase
LILLMLVGVAAVGVYFWPKTWINPSGMVRETQPLLLEKYDFDALKSRGGFAGKITIGGPIKAVEDRRKAAKKVYTTKFTTREIFFTSNGKKISGMINYQPEKSSLSKVIIMVRGYADKPGYYPGSGSWAVADKLAEAGYATVSLDFLGYADSDEESGDMMEARFEKVVSVLDLIESVKQLPWVDKDHIGIWAHSNGGQITLSVLEVTGARYPTVLWAPMTNPFPQSIIDTAPTLDDGGKAVMATIAEFEKHYDARRYAFENYYDWIQAPILIQQGTADDQVKVDWQRNVVENLTGKGKQVKLMIYDGDDHNLKKNWETAVEEDVKFLEKRFN